MSGPNPPRLEASSLFVEQNKKDHIRCEIYNTILSRVHQKIQATNRLPGNTQQLIYLVPEFIPGVPRFDMKECIIYLAYNLRSSGFFVNYTHPNALYISWKEQARNYRINESPYTKSLIQITECRHVIFRYQVFNILHKKILRFVMLYQSLYFEK